MQYENLKKQFQGFINFLQEQGANEYEMKLINLILQNFDLVASCGTAAGKRGKLLYDLIIKHGKTISNQFEQLSDEEKPIDVVNIQKLISLQVEKFRGFTVRCNFNLEKQFLLVYGINGSGKSSFCEALEFCLLGDINEASQKKINIAEYIKNVDYADSHPPILKGVDSNGELVEIKSDYEQFHFSFIEKCRIDSFARLSSYTPGNQNELIATLFGLDNFNEFVKEFTDHIENYIPLESEAEKNYKLKAAQIEIQQKNKLLYEEELGKIASRKELVAKESKSGLTFYELDIFINGNNDKKGRLSEIQDELRKAQPEKFKFRKIDELNNGLKSLLDVEVTSFTKYQSEFIKKINEINLTNLYTALINVERIETDKCPACETPLTEAHKNPFINAKGKLEGLKTISELQENRNKSWSDLLEKSNQNIQDIRALIANLKIINKEVGVVLPKELLTNLSISDSSTYISKLQTFISDFLNNKNLVECESILMERNNLHEDFILKQQNLLEENNKLSKTNEKIIQIKAEEKNYSNLTLQIKDEIETFNNTNEQLLKDIEAEKKLISENVKYVEAYKSFKGKLNNYKDKLPLKLIEDLGDLTKEFYNEINIDDQEFELFAEVQLPAKANENIQIAFRDNPSKFQNALHVLSEGHIKCLGLSILLAKCVSSELCFLVFDDVVNAIDDDHRGRIAELLFKNQHFKGKQIIITSHSEEFIKDIENLMFSKSQYEELVGKIVFNKRRTKRIEHIESTFQYIKKAETYLLQSNKRDCLSNIRRALESLSEQLWRKLINFENKKYNVEISLILRHPSGKADLMNVVTGLRKFLSKIENDVLNKIRNHLEWFIGLETHSPRIWDFLNKGTHDESGRDDFDNSVVKEILERTIKLDELGKSNWSSQK